MKERPADDERGFSTRSIHAGDHLNPTRAMVPPIFQSTTFELESARHGAEFAKAHAPPDFYTRWGNPTLKQVEAVLASLERAQDALVFASGMGAISATLLSVVSAGDHLLVGQSIYSGTHEMATGFLPRFGVETSFADSTDPVKLREALRPNTRAIIVESPTNPTLDLTDLEDVARLGREHGVVTIVDNTFATPANQSPIEFGIDIVVHSATKALGGHGDVTCGVVCSTRERIEKAWYCLKLLGACLSPFEGWLLLRGLKTLELRAARQSASAFEIARFLESRPEVREVHYPGLESHPQHDLARRQMRGFGGLLSFTVDGSVEDVARLAESLDLVTLAVSLGGPETLVSHPASMSHASLSESELRRAGIDPGLLRLSVGLESPDDLISDLGRALASRRT